LPKPSRSQGQPQSLRVVGAIACDTSCLMTVPCPSPDVRAH
jgi:hypothetical protein